jgi:branched-chain amino acid transport system substrate-binding protein
MNAAKLLLAAGLAAGLGIATQARAADPVKVALIADETGPLEAYAKQTVAGFKLGLEYYTNGSNAVAGRQIALIEKDSQTKPDVGRSALSEAFGDDNADLAVGGTSSAVALAMLPVAEEFKKVLIVEPAVADEITGAKWNRYIFRTARNSSQDAIANAKAVGKPGVVIATLAQDYAFGHDGVAAFKKALEGTGAKVVDEEYAPQNTTDFTAPAQRIFDALDKAQGKKILFVIWAGGNPFAALQSLAPEKHDIAVASGGNILPALAAYKAFPGMEGATYYYYDIPKNKANDWLVAEHTKRFGAPPDFFTAGGFSAAGAVVATLTKTGGKTDSETLIKAMEGMSFDTPKGTMTFRAADHQAMQSMFGFKVKVDPAVKWAVLEPTKEITPAEMDVPVMNKR